MAAPDKSNPHEEATFAGRAATRTPSSSDSETTAYFETAVPLLEPGTIVSGRYEILAVLGQGGMGAVYKAQDRELNRVVALKTIRPEMAASAEMLARFKQEVLLASQITHPNIIRLYDLGEGAGMKFITMEFIQGQDLRSLLLSRGKLSPAESVEIIRQVCLALQAAHAKGVIHRDLKPQNVMLGEDARVVVMDFGLARSLAFAGMTQTGALMGTMEYMSPEQAMAGEVDQRSDVFAVGLIFFELLTGQMPYQADSALASLLKRAQERAVPASDVDVTIPRSLSNVVSRCLEREAGKRYQNVTELLDDLDRHVDHPHPAFRLWRRPTPKIWAAIAAGFLTLVLVTAAIGLHSRFISTPRTAVAAAPAVSLAILPLRNASGDASIDWLGASVAEMLGTNIGQSAQVRTVSSGRVQQILQDLRLSAGANLDPDTVRQLASFSNADVVVWGQYVKPSGQIRLDLTLQDLKHARSVALEADAANDKDLIPAVDRLAKAIRDNLSLPQSATRELQTKSFQASSTSVEALRDYSEGEALRRQGRNLEAVKKFEDATRADPQFALAFSSLGDTYAALGHDDQARDAARRAVDLSQQFPPQEKYAIEGNYARITHNPAKAIESYERLARVLPNDVDALFRLGSLYERSGAFDKARATYSQVLERDPKFVDALVASGRVEVKSGKPQDALDYFNRALSLAVQVNNSEEKATILHALGMAYQGLGRPDDALLNFQQSLEIKRRLGDLRGSASSLNQIAQIQDMQGNSTAARASYQEAVQTWRKLDDKADLSQTLMNLGWFYQRRGHYDEALNLFKEALQINLELDDQMAQGYALNSVGNLNLSAGRYDDALTYLQQALQLREKLKVPGEIAQTSNNLGEVSVRLGDFDKALAYYMRALELWRSAGNKHGVAVASFNLGTLFDLQGRFGAALASDSDALKISRELGDRAVLADALGGYGEALTLTARFGEAQKNLDEALQLARAMKSGPLIAQALNFEGERFFYAGDYKAARTHYEQALRETSRQPGTTDQYLVLLLKLNLARLTISEGHPQAAIPMLRELSQKARSQWMKYVSARCSLDLGQALLATKDYRAARPQLEDALRAGQDMNLRLVTVRSHYLLAQLLRQTGNTKDAAAHQTQARQLLDDIRKEAGTDDIVKRSDLAAIQSESLHDTAK